MKRQIWTGGVIAAALAFGVGMSAQTSSTAQSGSMGTVTVTGCVEHGGSMSGATGTSGSGTSSATSGTSGTSSSSDQYILANARMGSGSSASSATTGSGSSTTGSATSGTTASGTSGSSMSGTSGTQYILEGSTSELKNHVGHEVEIKGRLESSSSSTYGSGSGTTGSATTGSGTSTGSATSSTGSTAGRTSASSSAQKLNVESVRMIASTCSSK